MLRSFFVFFYLLVIGRWPESQAFQSGRFLSGSVSRSISLLMSSVTGAPELQNDTEETRSNGKEKNEQTGKVYVCTNRWCRDKGSEATMATFSFLCPDSIPVKGVNCLGRCNKGPNARILTRNNEYVDVSMVRSVDTVVSLLKTHLFLDVNTTSAEALRLNYEGNVHLRNGDVDRAIDCYNTAISFGDKEQEGVLLVMRGTALLQRCYVSRMRFRSIISFARAMLPSIQGIITTIEALAPLSPYARALTVIELLSRANNIFKDIEASALWNEMKLKWPEDREGKPVKSGEELLYKATFAWYKYEYTLISAMEDLLSATVVLPGFPQAWRRAGDALSEMKFFTSAIEYYEEAVRLDPSFSVELDPQIEKLKSLQAIFEEAEAKGWPTEFMISFMDDMDTVDI